MLMAILGILNVLFIAKLVWLHWYLSTKKGWFKKDHLQFPKWLTFGIGLAGIFIPATPFIIDGMIVAALLYFGNEWVYQKTKWSPLRDTFVWIWDFLRSLPERWSKLTERWAKLTGQ